MILKNRFLTTAVVALTAPALFGAQIYLAPKSDGCVDTGNNTSEKTLDRILKDRGIGSSPDDLLSALSGPSPDIRGLSAQALAMKAGHIDVSGREERLKIFTRLSESWLKETDACARAAMDSALMKLGTQFFQAVLDARGGGFYPVPFVSCTAPDPSKLALSVTEQTGTKERGGLMRVTLRNISPEPLVFFKYRSPAEIFSATVLDASDRPVGLRANRRFLYMPAAKRSKLTDLQVHGTNLPFPLALQPNEQTSWDWDVAEDFDLSTPGRYRVRLGGPLNYLNTEVCSDAAEVRIQ